MEVSEDHSQKRDPTQEKEAKQQQNPNNINNNNNNNNNADKKEPVGDFLNSSCIIRNRWKIAKKLGQGAFGEIYQAKNVITNEMVAIKVEKVATTKQVLKLEVAVLKKLQDSSYVCRFITCGRFSAPVSGSSGSVEYNYMVMELLADNLSELRRNQPDQKFSLGTTVRLGQQMIKAIQAVHELGYLHRDIKPSNFAIGKQKGKTRSVFIIDFGLARRFLGSGGEVRPPRDSAGFRGTARYASINSHDSKDLGRRDDLWSLFYVLIEFVKGSLPWRKLRDKDKIAEMKKEYSPEELLKDLPSQFLQFMNYLQSLKYEENPDYLFLNELLEKIALSINLDHNSPFDWEAGTTSIKENLLEKTRTDSRGSLKNRNTSKYTTADEEDEDLSSEKKKPKKKTGASNATNPSAPKNNTNQNAAPVPKKLSSLEVPSFRTRFVDSDAPVNPDEVLLNTMKGPAVQKKKDDSKCCCIIC